MRLMVLVLIAHSVAFGASSTPTRTSTLTPTITPTPGHEMNIESIQIDDKGIDIQYRYISPQRIVKAWDSIRILRNQGESDKALYERATDAVVSLVTANEVALKAVSTGKAKPTPSATPTRTPK